MKLCQPQLTCRREKSLTHIRLAPNPWFAETFYQIPSSKQHDLVLSLLPITHRQSSAFDIELVIEMLKDNGSALIFWLSGLPGIHHEPSRRMLYSELAHSDTINGSC